MQPESDAVSPAADRFEDGNPNESDDDHPAHGVVDQLRVVADGVFVQTFAGVRIQLGEAVVRIDVAAAAGLYLVIDIYG